MIENREGLFIVTDLKQYAFCPRVVYFERCLPDFRPRTYKMDAGKQEHAHEAKRAARRRLTRFGLDEAERYYDVWLESPQLGLIGRLDEVLVTPEAAYPVDYKLSEKVQSHHRLQIAAYAALVEDQWQMPVPHGYIVLIGQRRAETVIIGETLKEQFIQVMEDIRRITYHEYLPPPPHSRRPCQVCEFRRACNDF